MRKYLFLLIVLALLLCGLTACSTSKSSPTEKESEMIQQFITVQDLESCIDAIGKKPAEFGITLGSSDYTSDLQGTVLGCPVHGYAFYHKSQNKEPYIESIHLYPDELTLTACYPILADLYSGPVEFGEEPYAEVNGGARTWFRFDAGSALIELSQGNKESSCTLSLIQNSNPSLSGKLILSTNEIKTNPDICLLPLIVSVKATQYDNGLLTVIVDNKSGEDLTFSGDFELSVKNTDNTYSELIPIYSAPIERVGSFSVNDLEKKEITLDLRLFGKVKSGDYCLHLDGLDAYFSLS